MENRTPAACIGAECRRTDGFVCADDDCAIEAGRAEAPLVPIEWPAWSLSDEAKAQLADIDRHTWGPFRGR